MTLFTKYYYLTKILRIFNVLKKPFLDFSQLGEEKIIINILERISAKHKINQCYIDIGGFDPIIYSNTYKLYNKNWSGVVVEPNKKVTKYWNKVRPNDFVINSALVPNTYKFEEVKIYTNNQNKANDSRIQKSENQSKNFYISKVIKLNELISICEKKFSKPFFLNLDIEGYENDIILDLNDINYKIPLICVELFLNRSIEDQSIFNYKNLKSVKYLEDNGYILVSVYGISLIFCHKDLWIPFSR